MRSSEGTEKVPGKVLGRFQKGYSFTSACELAIGVLGPLPVLFQGQAGGMGL